MKRIGTITILMVLLFGLSSANGAWAALTQKATLTDYLHTGTTTKWLVDIANTGNETPQRVNGTAYTNGGPATNFTWGGYFTQAPTGSGTNNGIYLMDNNPEGIFIDYAWVGNTYVYTLFDSNGGNTPDQYLDLSGPNATFSIKPRYGSTSVPGSFWTVRVMLRANAGAQWYVSAPVTMPQLNYYTAANSVTQAPVMTFSLKKLKWYAATSAVNTNLNALAASDEVALAWNSAPATPDFSKVDGGGVFIADVTGTDTTYIGKYSTNGFCINRPTWTADDPAAASGLAEAVPGLKATCAPSYTVDPSALVLTPASLSASPQTAGTITVGVAVPSIPLTITSVALNDPAHEFSATGLPAGTTTLNAANPSFTADINWTPSAPDNKESSASLRVICDAGGVPGTAVDIPIRGRDKVDGTIYESFVSPGVRFAENRTTYPKQTPRQMTPPAAGSGFTWGGYTNATARETNARDYISISNNRMAFNGALIPDDTSGSCYKNSYVYTIFDTFSYGAAIDRTCNLHKFQFYSDVIPSGAKVRWLVRDDRGYWFLSKDITAITTDMANKFNYVDVDDMTQGWFRVDTAAETYMNSLPTATPTAGNIDQVGISDPDVPGNLQTGTPNLARITGGGIYIEQGNTTPDNTALTFCDLNFIARPSSGDTLKVTAAAKSETYKVPNRRLAMAGLTFDVTSGVDAALDGVDVTVTPNTTGLRSIMLYSDPNGNGLPEDGAELTTCQLDANGTTAHVLFRDNQIFLAGTPRKMALVAMFDETATSKTCTLSIAPAQWKLDPENGGTGDILTSAPNPVTAAVTVGSTSLPATANLIVSTMFSETWDNATAGVISVTPATGPLTGADNLWNYTWNNSYNALFALKNGSMALGAEVRTMTTEPPLDSSFRVDASMNTTANFDDSAVRLAKLTFDLAITSATGTTAPAHLSGRITGEQKNVTLRLAASNNTDACNFTFYPLTDANRYIFGINAVAGGVTGMSQFAPGNILAYSTGDGTGTYNFTLYLAPLGTTATIAKVDMKHAESGKTLSWMTVLDGKIANLRNLRLAFGSYPDAYVDNLKLTTYSYYINPVAHWTMFE